MQVPAEFRPDFRIPAQFRSFLTGAAPMQSLPFRDSGSDAVALSHCRDVTSWRHVEPERSGSIPGRMSIDVTRGSTMSFEFYVTSLTLRVNSWMTGTTRSSGVVPGIWVTYIIFILFMHLLISISYITCSIIGRSWKNASRDHAFAYTIHRANKMTMPCYKYFSSLKTLG